jgi:hypothetical protein
MIRSLLAVLVLVVSLTAFGQAKKQNDNSLKGVPFKERIVFGGGFGLGFGSAQDFISVSPVIGYSLTKKLMAGTSFMYRYTNFKAVNPSLKLTDYAVSPFARYMVYKGFFLQTEYEFLNYENIAAFPETRRDTFGSFLAGGGLIQPIGSKAVFYVMALYNFSYEQPVPGRVAPYDSPLVLRAGVNIGGFLGL